MKKTGLILASLMLVGTVAMATSDPVYSVNTVGYQKLNVAPNWNSYNQNWSQVGGVDEISIQQLVDTSTLLKGGDAGAADNLFVWNPTKNTTGGYEIYYLYTDGQWYWTVDDMSPATNTIARGQGFWIRHKSTQTNTVASGEVAYEGTNVVTFGANQWVQFGSAYTADLELNGPKVTWNGNKGGDAGSSDNIWVWDPVKNTTGGYEIYYLYSDGQWYWIADDMLPTAAKIPMGYCAWYKCKGPSSATLTEVRPY